MVRSAKEKRYEQLTTIIKTIRNSKKIKDFNKMETSFQELGKAYDKARPVIAKEENGVTPRFFVRILVEMEDLINETWEDKAFRKNMNKTNAKSLGSLRQKLRKYVREEFDDDMAKFRENPDAPDDEEEEEKKDSGSDSDSDDDGPANFRKSDSKSRESSAPVSKSKAKKAAMGSDDDSDDSYWDSDSDETSSSDSDGEIGMSLREKFLKKSTDDGDKRDKKEKKDRVKRPKVIREDDDEDDEDGKDWVTVERGGAEKPKMFEKDAEIDHDLVVKKLIEIMAARGKKRTNRKEQIDLLSELLEIANEHNLGKIDFFLFRNFGPC